MPGAPTVVFVGTPRDVGCWVDRRDFLNFLKNDMLMETEKKKCLRRQSLSQQPGLTVIIGHNYLYKNGDWTKTVRSFLTLDDENPQSLTIHEFVIDIYYFRKNVRQGTRDD
jgi:hypothetical protein